MTSLTIIVPTFNRAQDLDRLLLELRDQCTGIDHQLELIIGDNASNDNTQAVVEKYKSSFTNLAYLRHDVNVGPDENFSRCVDAASTDYFWIIGDDDLPIKGTITAALKFLEGLRPDLVYFNSKWLTPPLDVRSVPTPSQLDVYEISAPALVRYANVWTTFISGWIVRKKFAGSDTVRKYAGTNLVQLGWILKAIQSGQKFLYVKTECIIATAGSSGGYAVMNVFGNNFPKIVRSEIATPQLAGAVIFRHTIDFLPKLVLGSRRAKIGKFESDETVTRVFAPQLGSTGAFNLILKPISTAPVRIAFVIGLVARLMAKMIRSKDWLEGRLTGEIKQAQLK